MKHLVKIQILLCALLTILALSAQAQLNPEWIHTYGGSFGDAVREIIKTSDGGYLTVGATESSDGSFEFNNNVGSPYEGQTSDVAITKLDANGNLLWTATYGSPKNEQGVDAYEVVDGYIITAVILDEGSITFPNGDVNNQIIGEEDGWMFKIDFSGDFRFDYGRFGGCKLDKFNATLGVSKFMSNNPPIPYQDLIAVGQSYSNSDLCGGPISQGNGASDVWVTRLEDKESANGTHQVMWSKNFGGSQTDVGMGVVFSAGLPEGYAVAGYSNSPNILSYNTIHPGFNGWYLEVDLLGNAVSGHTYGGSGNDYFTDVAQVATSLVSNATGDSYVFVGFTNSTDGDLANAANHGGYDIWVIRVEVNGSVVWSQRYGGSGLDIAYSVSTDAFITGKEIIVGGLTYSKDGQVAASAGYNPSLGNGDCWVLKLDWATGNIVESRVIGGSQTDACYDVLYDSSSHKAVAGGRTSSYNGDIVENYGEVDQLVAKFGIQTAPNQGSGR